MRAAVRQLDESAARSTSALRQKIKEMEANMHQGKQTEASARAEVRELQKSLFFYKKRSREYKRALEAKTQSEANPREAVAKPPAGSKLRRPTYTVDDKTDDALRPEKLVLALDIIEDHKEAEA